VEASAKGGGSNTYFLTFLAALKQTFDYCFIFYFKLFIFILIFFPINAPTMKRRDFIKTSASVAPLMSIFPADLSSIFRENVKGKLEKRSLGKTGEKLSIIGFGGIVVMNATPDQASSSVKAAIDVGVNYFDVAPSYGDAEIKLGPALEPYRKDVFLSNKTGKRNRDEARVELEQSLKNLRTNYFDLYQLHAVTSLEDVDTIFGKGGAMETILEAKKEGKIKYIGFSAHSVEAALALMNGFDFDTIMFPFNVTTWHAGNFGPQVLALAKQKKMGIIALKAMAKGKWPQDADRTKYPKAWYEPLTSREDILMGLNFTLSHPITTAIPPGEVELFNMALNLRDQIKPLKKAEAEKIKEKAMAWDPLFSYQG
jgi:aryl-alcohol dehydrogenase-like predicted oxidoreductase